MATAWRISCLSFCSEGAELGCRLAPGTTWIGLQTDRQAIEKLGFSLPNSHAGILPCGAKERTKLFLQLKFWLAEFRKHAAEYQPWSGPIDTLEENLGHVLTCFASALSTQSRRANSPTSRHYYQIVTRALDRIESNLTSTIRIGDLCVELGTEFRTLERAFLSTLGVAPLRFVQLRRMALARRMLLELRRIQVPHYPVVLSGRKSAILPEAATP